MGKEHIVPSRFKDKVTIVTGGASGIGKQIAMRFAREDATIVVPDINYEVAKDTARIIEDMGTSALPLEVDVSKAEEVRNMTDEVVKRFKKIDILINNAGIVVREPLLDMDPEKWKHEISVDLNGVAFCTKYAALKMKENNGGKIVNISSVSGLIGAASPAYSAAKGGVNSLTRVLAGELAPYNININTICPGFVATPINKNLREKGLEEIIAKNIPLKRWGKPEDISNTAAFLASEEADYITGAILQVDGGLGSFIDFGEEYRQFDKG